MHFQSFEIISGAMIFVMLCRHLWSVHGVALVVVVLNVLLLLIFMWRTMFDTNVFVIRWCSAASPIHVMVLVCVRISVCTCGISCSMTPPSNVLVHIVRWYFDMRACVYWLCKCHSELSVNARKSIEFLFHCLHSFDVVFFIADFS